jgi:AraC-like DNA-binding protein
VNDLVRASALLNFDGLVRDLGGDPGPILTDAHLRADLLGDTDAYIPFRGLARVVERAATELACPDFALRLSMRQSIEILGPIALIARHSATSLEALRGIAQHMHNYSPALRIGVHELSAATTRYTFEVVVSGLPSHVQVHELGLGVSLGIYRLLIGPRFRPLRVAFPHAALSDPEVYRRFFGCPVDFNAECCAMDISNHDLARRRSADDRQVREHVSRYLESAGAQLGEDLTARVRHLVTRTLPTGHASAVTVSAHLGLHTRTLQRWLATEGTTFAGLVDDVRRERARHYLEESDLPLGQIATMLGYSQQSCLSRASVRWFAASPRAVRGARRAAVGAGGLARARRPRS